MPASCSPSSRPRQPSGRGSIVIAGDRMPAGWVGKLLDARGHRVPRALRGPADLVPPGRLPVPPRRRPGRRLRRRRGCRGQGPRPLLPQPRRGQGLAGVQGRARARRRSRARDRRTARGPRPSLPAARGRPAHRVRIRARPLAMGCLAAAGRGHAHGRQPGCQQEHARRRPRRPHHDRARAGRTASRRSRRRSAACGSPPRTTLAASCGRGSRPPAATRRSCGFVKGEVVFPSGKAPFTDLVVRRAVGARGPRARHPRPACSATSTPRSGRSPTPRCARA